MSWNCDEHEMMGANSPREFPDSCPYCQIRAWIKATEPVSRLPWRSWHYANLDIRINGENRTVGADWLKNIAYLRESSGGVMRKSSIMQSVCAERPEELAK